MKLSCQCKKDAKKIVIKTLKNMNLRRFFTNTEKFILLNSGDNQQTTCLVKQLEKHDKCTKFNSCILFYLVY